MESVNNKLKRAAQCGDINLCECAKDEGATNFDEMFMQAAEADYIDLCFIAKEWGAKKFNSALALFAKRGNKELCQLMKDWGATNFNKCFGKLQKVVMKTYVNLQNIGVLMILIRFLYVRLSMVIKIYVSLHISLFEEVKSNISD